MSTTQNVELPLRGGCGCGAVRFEVTEPLVSALYCHCTRCQRRTGTAASGQARSDGRTFRYRQGEDMGKAWRHPEGGFEKCFCGDCGSALFRRGLMDAETVAEAGYKGLMAGKGVVIAGDEAEARQALESFLVARRFGTEQVVVEEHLEGKELYLLALCDGRRAVPLASAQDYTRSYDGDRGPNTGGRGDYSPVPAVDQPRAAEVCAA